MAPGPANLATRSLPPEAITPPADDASRIRHDTLLTADWHTLAVDTGVAAPADVATPSFDDHAWQTVAVPHNWDAYEGFHQVRHGDRHGTAWYRRTFDLPAPERGRRVFLFFEGVGSYATVWVNGTLVGHHAGGLTTFTLDVTNAVRFGASNRLVVRADHPAGIRDLPWVCGGCERAYGFSEGTQPFGIFRPVHLITTAPVRVEPFGVHVWNDATVDPTAAQLHVTTEVRNYDGAPHRITLVTRVLERPAGLPPTPSAEAAGGAANSDMGDPALRRSSAVAEVQTEVTLGPGETKVVAQEPPPIRDARLWSPTSPHLYELSSEIVADEASTLAPGREREHPDPALRREPADRHAQGMPAGSHPLAATLIDAVTTSFGIRTIQWPDPTSADGRLRVNGQPVFINGTCDYEHNLGASHAFSSEQIAARVSEVETAGFNAFRDAHHPHNLRFQGYWDHDGLLWWTQFGAHVWFDNEAFRANFKTLLRDWVKERRNSPSLVLWGLQNESVLPTAFAEECSAIIRELDPTASAQRKITTCNGGTGTDWDVPQNWSGTYSGTLAAYADDLKRQRLVGEYGAWRSLGLHREGGFQAKGPLSEDRETALLETKVRLAETVRDQVAGHFLWVFTTHSNPGRNVGEQGEQLADGIRPLDQISPANNKGLFTIWGEPTDAYAMYRANFSPPATDPMISIASHTWPDRWTSPGRKSGIIVYSNCDEVELFNDLGERSLGRRARGPRGTHFQWDNVEIATNVLYAEGRVNGHVVARDLIQLHHLPTAPRFTAAQASEPDLLEPAANRAYLYRVNCGGDDYVDSHGNTWLADQPYRGSGWGALSWADAYPNLDPRFGSLRRTYDPISGTRDPALFQTFRYGRDQLKYRFDLPNGDYDVELYFVEPWYGDSALSGELKQASGQSAAVGDVHSGEADPAARLADAGARRDSDAKPSAGPLPSNGKRLESRAQVKAGVGWRVFDVAVNGETVLRHLDLVAEAGRDRAVKRVVRARVTNGALEVSFPRVAAGQAVISALAVTSVTPLPPGKSALRRELVDSLTIADGAQRASYRICHALDTGDPTYGDRAGEFSSLPGELLEADWLRTAGASATSRTPELIQFRVTEDATVFVAHAGTETQAPGWLGDWERTTETLATEAAPGTAFVLYRRAYRAGTSVVLGPNATTGGGTLPMYSVFVVPRRPAPPPQLVRIPPPAAGGSEGVAGSSLPARAAAIATGDARPGRELYPNAATRLLAVPANLVGGDLVAPLSDARFAVTDHVEVWLAVDARVKQQPDWLSDWIETRDTITTNDRAAPRFALVRQHFAPDATVHIGPSPTLPDGSTAMPCFAIVRAVRPTVLLEAEAAALKSATAVREPAGASASAAVELPPGADHAIEWTVTVGVGDRYGLNFRYTAPAATGATSALLTIVGADGHVVRSDKLEFPAVARPGHWQFLRTRTGASINAGTYRFQLTQTGAVPLLIDSLEVE